MIIMNNQLDQTYCHQIRCHHKQAINKLMSCMTNCGIDSVKTSNHVNAKQEPHIDHKILLALIQLIHYYHKQLNYIDDNSNEDNNSDISQHIDNNQMDVQLILKTLQSIRLWLLNNYCSHQLIVWLTSVTSESELSTLDENRWWTLALLVLNIMYKQRICLTEHKMMLELAWICLSELDPWLAPIKVNKKHLLSVLQNAINVEKVDNKVPTDECLDLQQEVKRLRLKIIDLQRNIIKMNKEKQLLTKRDVVIGTKTGGHKRMTNNSIKRAMNKDNESNDSQLDIKVDLKANDGFNCDICNKPFGSAYRLNRHMYSHTGQRPYSCLWPACNRQFNDNYHLKRHMLTHTGEKPYICESVDCGKRFSRPEDLKSHQKIHSLTVTSTMDNVVVTTTSPDTHI
ncbi:Krueppel-like factor 7 [Oppia nitens]|uniref:Krueppel-like factor 7 n=1 Tax=Oppia nitens TaxID=1686743 RepID=UPI0023D9FB6C|nr:Krueppel-like factor 7 [Oppia nitens]